MVHNLDTVSLPLDPSTMYVHIRYFFVKGKIDSKER